MEELKRGIEQQLGPGAFAKVTSVATTPSGTIILLTTGTRGDRSLLGLWAYQPGTVNVKLLAGAGELKDASTIGDALDLADGQLIANDTDGWLYLQGIDHAVIFHLDIRQIEAGEPARLATPFQHMTLASGQPFALQRGDRLFNSPEGKPAILRPSDGSLWEIQSSGAVTELPRDALKPPLQIPPLTLRDPRSIDRSMQLRFYNDIAAPVDLLNPPDVESTTRYPQFVLTGGARPESFDRDALHLRPGFPTYALRLTAWCTDRATNDVIAYDAMSGEVLRIKFSGVE